MAWFGKPRTILILSQSFLSTRIFFICHTPLIYTCLFSCHRFKMWNLLLAYSNFHFVQWLGVRHRSRPETLQGFRPLLAMIANLEIHRVTTPVLHMSTFTAYPQSILRGTTIEKPRKLKRVARQTLPIYLHFRYYLVMSSVVIKNDFDGKVSQ